MLLATSAVASITSYPCRAAPPGVGGGNHPNQNYVHVLDVARCRLERTLMRYSAARQCQGTTIPISVCEQVRFDAGRTAAHCQCSLFQQFLTIRNRNIVDPKLVRWHDLCVPRQGPIEMSSNNNPAELCCDDDSVTLIASVLALSIQTVPTSGSIGKLNKVRRKRLLTWSNMGSRRPTHDAPNTPEGSAARRWHALPKAAAPTL